jgi:hypothetical protein
MRWILGLFYHEKHELHENNKCKMAARSSFFCIVFFRVIRVFRGKNPSQSLIRMASFISRTARSMPTSTARDTMLCPMLSSSTPGMQAMAFTLQ